MTKRMGMVIDTKRCFGCHTCILACKMENVVPDNIQWNRVYTVGGDHLDTPSGKYPNVKMKPLTIACQHCENPACVKVCPVGATYRDEELGIVMQDPAKCIGCRYCMSACPYTGVRSFNWDEPQYQVDFPLGDPDAPVHQKSTVEKCILCKQRTEKGKQPMCVECCPARARYYGDLSDPESEVAKLVATRTVTQLLPEMGTNPSVFYLE